MLSECYPKRAGGNFPLYHSVYHRLETNQGYSPFNLRLLLETPEIAFVVFSGLFFGELIRIVSDVPGSENSRKSPLVVGNYFKNGKYLRRLSE